MRDIGKNIRDLRLHKNMTQDELAEKLFVTRQTVSNYETGKSRPDIDMLARIAEVLQMDVNHILYGLPTPPDRKAEYRCAAVAAGLCILLWALCHGLDSITWELYFRFRVAPRFLLLHLLIPSAYFLTGWTLFQGLSLFTGLRPYRSRCAAYTRWVLLLILAFISVHILPYPLSAAWGDILYLTAKHSGETSFTYSSGIQFNALHNFVFRLLSDYPAVLSLLGAGLWLCRFPKQKNT